MQDKETSFSQCDEVKAANLIKILKKNILSFLKNMK